jgi:hypothetical protein
MFVYRDVMQPAETVAVPVEHEAAKYACQCPYTWISCSGFCGCNNAGFAFCY